MRSYRTKEAQDTYLAFMKEKAQTRPDECDLCAKESITEYDHWKFIQNEFPYDLIATTHHMLIPLRHTNEAGLTREERDEFDRIRPAILNESYDVLIEMAHRNKSIPGHFHVHLIVGDDTYPNLGAFDAQ